MREIDVLPNNYFYLYIDKGGVVMGRKLTQKEFEQRVFEAVGNKYSVVSEYQGKTKTVQFHCNIHNIDFTATAECFMRGPNDVRTSCPQCHQEYLDKDKVLVTCAYCGKKFFKTKSSLGNSRSGQYFCCRNHKDLAQRVDSGEKFASIRPEHYGTAESNYRDKAFKNLPHKCAVCGYDEDERILQVHHRDSNRDNNSLENLTILCPNCHWKITLNLYDLTDDNQLIEK